MKPEEFVASVRNVFSFLEQDYDFSFSWESGYIVRYDSSRVFITVIYDATRSYELGFQIGLRTGTIGHPFEIWTILRAVGQGELHEAKAVIRARSSDLMKYLETFQRQSDTRSRAYSSRYQRALDKATLAYW